MYTLTFKVVGPIPGIEEVEDKNTETVVEPLKIEVNEPGSGKINSQFLERQNELDSKAKALDNYASEIVPAIQKTEKYLMNENCVMHNVAVRKLLSNGALQTIAAGINMGYNEFLAGLVHEVSMILTESAYLENAKDAIASALSLDAFNAYWRRQTSIFFTKPATMPQEQYEDLIEELESNIADLLQTALLRYLAKLSDKFGYKEYVGTGSFNDVKDLVVITSDEED